MTKELKNIAKEDNTDALSHRAYNLYVKADESGVSHFTPTDSGYFTDLVKHVANKMNLSLVATKEAIYQGYANVHNLSYEEGKAEFKKTLI